MSVERGVEDVEAGRVIPQEEVGEYFSYPKPEEEELEEVSDEEEWDEEEEEEQEDGGFETRYGLTADLDLEEDEDEE